jgi:NADH-quinone oxidoreductase subunit J
LAHNLILFYAFGGLAVITSLLVVLQSNPVYSVLLLIGSFMALAGLYVLLSAPFAAVIQIIVYAGAIMVLFLFVVMLLNAPQEESTRARIMEAGTTRVIGGLLAVAFVAELIWALSRSGSAAPGSGGAGERESAWSVGEIGQIIFTEYAFAFEATSVLILVAMVGAVALAGRHVAGKRLG